MGTDVEAHPEPELWPRNDAQPILSAYKSLDPVWRDDEVADWDALPVCATVVCQRRRLLRDNVQWSTYNALKNILCTP